jgi:hypothetical protein
MEGRGYTVKGGPKPRRDPTPDGSRGDGHGMWWGSHGAWWLLVRHRAPPLRESARCFEAFRAWTGPETFGPVLPDTRPDAPASVAQPAPLRASDRAGGDRPSAERGRLRLPAARHPGRDAPGVLQVRGGHQRPLRASALLQHGHDQPTARRPCCSTCGRIRAPRRGRGRSCSAATRRSTPTTWTGSTRRCHFRSSTSCERQRARARRRREPSLRRADSRGPSRAEITMTHRRTQPAAGQVTEGGTSVQAGGWSCRRWRSIRAAR